MAVLPNPGDFAVINTGSNVTAPIVDAEELADAVDGVDLKTQWDHAVICSRVDPDGTVWIVEAEPGGAREVKWHYADRPHKWSTGIIATNAYAAVAARRYVGVPYSYLDYVALTIHTLHIPFPWLKTYVANSKHMICSQLVDQAELDAGVHLFSDGRWAGFVKPSDLGHLLGV